MLTSRPVEHPSSWRFPRDRPARQGRAYEQLYAAVATAESVVIADLTAATCAIARTRPPDSRSSIRPPLAVARAARDHRPEPGTAHGPAHGPCPPAAIYPASSRRRQPDPLPHRNAPGCVSRCGSEPCGRYQRPVGQIFCHIWRCQAHVRRDTPTKQGIQHARNALTPRGRLWRRLIDLHSAPRT